MVTYEIVLHIFKYELRIQRLNVNSRVSRIEDQIWEEVEHLFNVFVLLRVDRLKEDIMNLKYIGSYYLDASHHGSTNFEDKISLRG